MRAVEFPQQKSQRNVYPSLTTPLAERHDGVMDYPACSLSHDINNKVFAILGHCDELELRVPSPWCFDRTAKIKALAKEISALLHRRRVKLGDPGARSLTKSTADKSLHHPLRPEKGKQRHKVVLTGNAL